MQWSRMGEKITLISKSFSGGGPLNETYQHASLLGQRSVRCSSRRGYNGGCISVTGIGVSGQLCEGGKTYDAMKFMIYVCKELIS